MSLKKAFEKLGLAPKKPECTCPDGAFIGSCPARHDFSSVWGTPATNKTPVVSGKDAVITINGQVIGSFSDMDFEYDPDGDIEQAKENWAYNNFDDPEFDDDDAE